MQRSKLRNLYLKVRSDENRIMHKKQRNICVSLLRKAKSKHYEDLRLEDLYLKVRSDENRIMYKKQRNICVSLLRKAKTKHYEDLRLADVTNNKKFWKRVKPLFGNKIKGN